MSTQSKVVIRLTPLGHYYALLVVGIFLAAMVRQVNLLLLLAGLIAAPLVLSWRLAKRNLKNVRVHRRLPSRVCVGDLVVVELELKLDHPRGKAWMISVEDTVSRNSGNSSPFAGTPRVFFPYVEGTQPYVQAYRGRIGRRGCYTFGPLQVRTRFPLGLFEARREIRLSHQVCVCPRLGRLKENWYRRHHFAHEGETRSERCADRVSGDFYGLRSWQTGDSPRLIHWRSSARHGEFLVRQFDRPRQQHLTVLLNLFCANSREGGEDPQCEETIEKAISFVATVIHDLCRKGGRSLLLGVSGDEITWIGGAASPGFLERVMELLARVEPTGSDRLIPLFAEARRRSPPQGDFLVVTTSPVRFGSTASGESGDVPSSGKIPRPLPRKESGAAMGSLTRRLQLDVVDVVSGDLEHLFDYKTTAVV